MKINDLAHSWGIISNSKALNEEIAIQLSVDDSIRLSALAEMYPNRSKESIVHELLSAALDELETSFPYIKGQRVIAEDELGDPIYEDIGPTPEYLKLTKKHLHAIKNKGCENKS